MGQINFKRCRLVMTDTTKLITEVVNMRTDILYLIHLVEKLEAKIAKLEQVAVTPPMNPFKGKIIEKL
jgi:hypothetical protein